ncbi:hypothetical protein HELRODRAFT_180054 [Helobdella robusta]|uniref:Uncharacterized protein n=1 Tax=Helobdella robusta TaxID=6412 RepID=T1FFE8_HELRO|nr:hypothetical protein HELRODRAFT_180054 [Helobdella robusta]ESN94725.1 hypothetical protein HELRODRAFT_180054 [Helobdella robusta]
MQAKLRHNQHAYAQYNTTTWNTSQLEIKHHSTNLYCRPGRIIASCAKFSTMHENLRLPTKRAAMASLGLVSPGAVTHGVTPLMTPHRHTAFLAKFINTNNDILVSPPVRVSPGAVRTPRTPLVTPLPLPM